MAVISFDIKNIKGIKYSIIPRPHLLIETSNLFLTIDSEKEFAKINNLKVFDDIFSVEEVSIFKPDSKVYDIPVKKYKIKKSEVAFLSANTWDVSGGGNYGFNAIWVNRNNIIFDNLDYSPENQINNLKHLLDII